MTDSQADPSRVRPGDPTFDAQEGPGADVSADTFSLMRRLRQPRTIVSLVVPLLLIILLARALPGFELDQLPARVLAANPLLLLAALAVYYVGFPLRGYRWSVLLGGAGTSLGVRDSTEIIFISWMVNCLVPAKLGDLYRAYLLRLHRVVSTSRTIGTIVVERVMDLFAIAILGLAAGFWSFRSGFDPYVQFVLGLGIVVVLVLAAGVFTMRNFGRRILVAFPVPHPIVEMYDRFEQGFFSLRARHLPRLATVTVLIWTTEALRLLLVIAALGYGDLRLGLSGVFFVALAASLLTAVPLTPAGIGVVEAGMVGILTAIYTVPRPEALTIALVDRAISVLSVIVFGAIVYVWSDKTKVMRRAGSSAPAPRAP